MSIINCIKMCKDKERKSNMIMMMQLNRYYDILLLYQSIKYLCRKLYNEPQSGDDKTICWLFSSLLGLPVFSKAFQRFSRAGPRGRGRE